MSLATKNVLNLVKLPALLLGIGDALVGFFLAGGVVVPSWRTAAMRLGMSGLAVVLFVALGWPTRTARCPRLGNCFQALAHVATVVLGASVCPTVRHFTLGGVALGAHPFGVYFAALAIFLYVVAYGEVRLVGGSDQPVPSRRYSLPFLALVFVMLPVVFSWVPDANEKSGPLAMAGSIAAMLPLLNAFMLWRVYPRYVGGAELAFRHSRNLMRVQAALVIATCVASPDFIQPLVGGLLLYLLASFYNYFSTKRVVGG